MDDASLNPPFLTKEVEQMLLDEEVGAELEYTDVVFT